MLQKIALAAGGEGLERQEEQVGPCRSLCCWDRLQQGRGGRAGAGRRQVKYRWKQCTPPRVGPTLKLWKPRQDCSITEQFLRGTDSRATMPGSQLTSSKKPSLARKARWAAPHAPSVRLCWGIVIELPTTRAGATLFPLDSRGWQRAQHTVGPPTSPPPFLSLLSPTLELKDFRLPSLNGTQ